jgi:asparagine synthase (glutamine-hydrolysing)
VATLLQPEADLYEAVRGRGGDEVRAALAYFQRFYLTDDILVKADRASMLHSLEVRAPFLDTALVDFVNRLPSGLKYRFGSRKYLLKLAVSRLPGRSRLLPKQIVNRSKKGFGIPVAQWIRHDLRAEFEEKLIHDWPASLAMIERREVESLLAAHVQGRANNCKELWALFVLGEWARRWAA